MGRTELILRVILEEVEAPDADDWRQYKIPWGEARSNAKLIAVTAEGQPTAPPPTQQQRPHTTATITTDAAQLAASITIDAKTAPLVEQLVAIGFESAEAERTLKDFGAKRVKEVYDWTSKLALRQDITSRPQLIRTTLARRPRGR
jgi:hypothetical protein